VKSHSAPHILVVGSGPVGLALALALVRGSSLAKSTTTPTVTVIDQVQSLPNLPMHAFDHRVYALAPQNLTWLKRMGVALPAPRMQPIAHMRVALRQGQFSLSPPPGEPALAAITENAALVQGLATAVREAGITLRLGIGLTTASMDGDRAFAHLSDGSTLAADLIVGADGPHSRVRRLLTSPRSEKDYDESAIVAHFHAERPHHGDAYQWFSAPGTLAWLPLPNLNSEPAFSIVWSLPKQECDAKLRMDDATFAAAVETAGNRALGTLKLASPRHVFPLRFVDIDRGYEPRLLVIGDAAHVVHPLAGQGVNLGLGDARELAATLLAADPASIGHLATLARYWRRRRAEVVAMQATTDLLARWVAPAEGMLAKSFSLAFAGFDQAGPIKRALTRLAMS
jgi:2-polyprenylphenol 6-hydroxylase